MCICVKTREFFICNSSSRFSVSTLTYLIHYFTFPLSYHLSYLHTYSLTLFRIHVPTIGAYQPSLPTTRFIGTSSYNFPWQILRLPETATLHEYRVEAEKVCALSFSEVMFYFESHNLNMGEDKDKLVEMIPDFCFLTTYVYALLTEGYGFSHNHSITVVHLVNGSNMGWPLGSMLQEINSFPWELTRPKVKWEYYCMAASIGAYTRRIAQHR